jgi:hypothetical protein
MSKVPTPNIKINVSPPKENFHIKPTAFITILLHASRFWQAKNPKPQYSFGILIGKYEGSTRIVTEAIPITHKPQSEEVFQEDFFKHWDDMNALKEEIDAPERCIGWYKVIERDLKLKAADIRNQVKVQTLDRRNVAFLLDPRKFLTDMKGDYGFSVFYLKGDRIFHEMCDYDKMQWEVLEVGADVDKVVQMVIEMIRKYHSDKPFVEEIDEVKVPIPPKQEGDEEGDYVTPAVDPKQPFFM